MHQPAETASRASSCPLSRGVANMLLATFAFAVMNVFLKQLDRIPAMEIVFFRCVVSGLICAACALCRAGAPPAIMKKKRLSFFM